MYTFLPEHTTTITAICYCTWCVLAKYEELSLTNFLDYLNSLAEYARFIEYNEVYSPGEKRIITLMHSYGENGSIFVKTFAQDLFELIDVEPKLSSTNNSVTIEI